MPGIMLFAVSRCGRARRRQPQWYVLCWLNWLRYTSCCVPLSVGRPVKPGIMDGMLIVEMASFGRSWVGARCCATTGALVNFRGRCLIFCSSANVVLFLVVNRDRYQRWLRRPWRLHSCSSWWVLRLTLVAQCLARQRIHVHVQLWVAFGRISSIFFVKGCSDPAVDSRSAQSWFCWSQYALCCVPSFIGWLCRARRRHRQWHVRWFCLC